jgi:predicted O-methyltransferase YrrM
MSTENNQVNHAEILARKIYGELPAKTFLPVDTQSFLGDADFFASLIRIIQPDTIIEVGSWKGHSAIAMAEALHNLKLHSSRVLCVDTWLGSLEHWNSEEWRKQMHLKNGRPDLYERFLANVIQSGFANYIIPFPMTSGTAATFFNIHNVKADLIYIDAAHDYDSVKNDLEKFHPLLNENGILCGDDFQFPPLEEAVRDFARDQNLGLVLKDRKYVLLNDSQLNDFTSEPGFTTEINATILKANQRTILLSPVSDSDIVKVQDVEQIFSSDESEKVSLFEVTPATSLSEKTTAPGALIEAACFPARSVTEYNFIEKNTTYTSAPVYLVSIPSACISLPHSLVLSKFSTYWPDSLYLASWPTLPYITRDKQGLYLTPGKLNLRYVHEPVIFLPASSNYFHWHIDNLPIAFSLKERINSGKFKVLSFTLNDWHKRSLQLLGVDLSVIEQVAHADILCRSLIYSSHLSGTAFKPPEVILSMFTAIRKSCLSDDNENNLLAENAPEFIFISRQDSNNRKLINEDEIFNALRLLKFVKVVPGELTYDQQIRIFSKAKLIVAQHGAGLINMAFAPPGCKIIEIMCENYINISLWRLSQLLGFKYAYIVAKEQEDQKEIYHDQASFSAPASAIVNSVYHMLKER